MSTDALTRACTAAGGQSALAAKIGVAQSTLWHWLKRAKRGVPGEYVVAIEIAANSAVTRHELRPDIFPPPDEAPSSPEAHRSVTETQSGAVS